MAIAVILLWLASLAVFLSSKQQKLLDKPLSKLVGWGMFSVLLFFGWLFLLGEYSPLAAIFLALTYVMAAWITTVFVLGHYSIRLWQFGTGGAVVSLVIFYLGSL